MLTENEKKILGYMVDMGSLRGQERIDAGANDELARGLIATFTAQMQQVLPAQIATLTEQQAGVALEVERLEELLALITDDS